MFLSILTCKETLARLDDYLDRELEPHEVKLVERHLKICRHCSEIYAYEKDLVQQMRAKVARVETTDDQVQSLLGRIRTALPSEGDSAAESS